MPLIELIVTEDGAENAELVCGEVLLRVLLGTEAAGTALATPDGVSPFLGVRVAATAILGAELGEVGLSLLVG